MQRDVKKLVDYRLSASEAIAGGNLKVPYTIIIHFLERSNFQMLVPY